jgi:hemerythrin-like domain-containing protein
MTGAVARRRFIAAAGTVVAVTAMPAALSAKEDKDVGAVEDLMREHGVLRRALFVYSECARMLRDGGTAIDPAALDRAATLFRRFGEEYHETKLEEGYIFPALRSLGGALATYADVLTAQHKRGREITAYIVSVAGKGRVGTGDVRPLADALESFVRMYRPHAAREDTVIFPAWKESLSARQLDELGEKFEDIERRQFGKDGFDDAVKQMAEIEAALRLDELEQFTAPPPP